MATNSTVDYTFFSNASDFGTWQTTYDSFKREQMLEDVINDCVRELKR